MLTGWVRCFSLVSLGRLQRGVTQPSELEVAALAVRYTGNPDDVVIGALLDVPRSEIPEYIEREHRYQLRSVQCSQLPDTSSIPTRIKALVCIESTDEAYRHDPSKFDQSTPDAAAAAWEARVGQYYDVQVWGPLWGRKDILPAADYLSLCVRAAAELGGAAWANFLHGTLLADGSTRLAEFILRQGLPAHPLLGNAVATHCGAFALVGEQAVGSSAGGMWPLWWARTGSSAAPPPFLPCNAPPRPSHPEGREAHKLFMHAMVLSLVKLPAKLVRGFLVTGAKTDAFDALAKAQQTTSSEANQLSVQLDDDACMLQEVSTVVKHADVGAAASSACTSAEGHAYDLRACTAAVLQAVMELADAVEDMEPGASVSGYDCGWVDIAPAGAGTAATASGAAAAAAAAPCDKPGCPPPITTAPMCTVAGRQSGRDDSPWSRHLASFPAASCVLLGAGGACTALAVALLASPGNRCSAASSSTTESTSTPSARPGSLHMIDICAPVCSRAGGVLATALGGAPKEGPRGASGEATIQIHGLAVPVFLHACRDADMAAAVARRLLGSAGGGSWLVNGTGVGKSSDDNPLSPSSSKCAVASVPWPRSSVFWELNYRGPRPLLGEALQAHDGGGAPLVVMDGWRLFHTGWMLNASAVARSIAKEATTKAQA